MTLLSLKHRLEYEANLLDLIFAKGESLCRR